MGQNIRWEDEENSCSFWQCWALAVQHPPELTCSRWALPALNPIPAPSWGWEGQHGNVEPLQMELSELSASMVSRGSREKPRGKQIPPALLSQGKGAGWDEISCRILNPRAVFVQLIPGMSAGVGVPPWPLN